MKTKRLSILTTILLSTFYNPVLAQSPPTDLTELNVEEILSLHIIRQSVVEEDRTRLSVGYRYINAKFDGNRKGTTDLSVEDVLFRPGSEDRTTDNFPVVPLTIYQQAHLLELTYDVTRQWSVSLLLPYIHQQTDHVSSVIREIDGVVYDFSQFIIESSGLGDVVLSVSRPIWRRGPHFILATAGISLPTGSIDEVGPTPRIPGEDTQLPFTMQIGSGTYDFSPGLIYAGSNERLNWGGQLRSFLRLNTNDRDYSLGDRLMLSGWLKAKPASWVEPSLTITAQAWGRIDGDDEDLKITTLPVSPYPAAVTDPNKFGGEKINVQLGATFKRPKGFLKRHSIEIKGGLPLYQSLNGPQPKEIWRLGLDLDLKF